MKSKKFKRIAALLLTAVMVLEAGTSNSFIATAADQIQTEQPAAETGEQPSAEEEQADAGDTNKDSVTEKEESGTEVDAQKPEDQTQNTEDESQQNTGNDSQQNVDAEVQEGTETKVQKSQNQEKETVSGQELKSDQDPQNKVLATEEIAENALWGVYDLSRNEIDNQKWADMIRAAQNDMTGSGTFFVDGKQYTNVPVLSWTANTSGKKVSKVTSRRPNEDNGPWKWSDVSNISIQAGTRDVAGGSTSNMQAMADVWDGSRKATHNYEQDNYLPKDTITALDGKLYDSTTWEQDTNLSGYGGPYVEMYRYQAIVDFQDVSSLEDDAFTLLPVTGGDKIYINDDMFVFVYPEGADINQENFLDYLAFWTGTVNQNNELYFYDKQGVDAENESMTNPQGLAKLTNGWYVKATQDNVGQAILNGHKAYPNATRYVIDVFTDDYDSGGGMYRLKLGRQNNVRREVTFTKVSSVDTSTTIPGATFTLYRNESCTDEVNRTVSDENGKVTFRVLPGTYYMKETHTPNHYQSTNTVWRVQVSEQGNVEIKVWNGSHTVGENLTQIQNTPDGTPVTIVKENSSGASLEGAEFLLSGDNGVNKTVKSDENGVLREWTGQGGVSELSELMLQPGTYTLKETKAPEGYAQPSQVEWTIHVEKDNTYTVTVTEGKEEYLQPAQGGEPAQLRNFTNQEELSKNITVDKQVTKVYQDERTFDIKLTASGYDRDPDTPGSNASVVLVLDRSGSMDDGRYGRPSSYQKLKEAAKGFVNTLADKSAGSKVAVVTFANNAKKECGLTTLDATGKSNVLDAIETATNANGSTYTGSGMVLAENLLHEDVSGNQQYIVVFSDGVPSSSNTAGTAYQSANRMKNSGVTVYAIGYGSDLDDSFWWNWSDGNPTGSWTVAGSTFLKCLANLGNYSEADASTLDQIFRDIAGSIGEQKPLTGVTIKDTIDPRFELTEESKAMLEQKGAHVSEPDANGIVTITWNNETIGNAQTEESEKEGPWEATITVQAKDDFIGGNNIPTNGAGSGVWLDPQGEMTKEFPKPVVNVKLLESILTPGREVVFVGDTVDPRSYLTEWLNTQAAKPYIALTEEQIANLLASGNHRIEFDYSYPNTNNDVVGKISMTLSPEEMETFIPQETSDEARKYTLTLNYVPKTVEEREHLLSGSGSYNEVQGSEVGTKEYKEEHILKVVAGSIEVTKKIDGNHDFKKGDGIFTFRLTNEKTNKVYYETVRIDSNDNNTETVIFQNLPRGVYTIEELDTQAFQEGKITILAGGSHPCGIRSDRFYIGYGNDGTTKDNSRRNGLANVVNTPIKHETDTDNDLVINHFTVNQDGSISITPDHKTDVTHK